MFNDLMRHRMESILAVDFGSTYTKVAAFDLERERLIGISCSRTTVEDDITKGFQLSVDKLEKCVGRQLDNVSRVLACSSAAGGLRMVAVGLIKSLTVKAAEEAALGAGAKLIKTYANGLSEEDAAEIERLSPDMVLLCGGTDGGNKDFVVAGAKALSLSSLSVPIVIAGNKLASGTAKSILEMSGKFAVIEENVLPELDQLNVEPTRARIRELFMSRITHAKGLDKAHKLVGQIIMPTPMAVLKGASLLSNGCDQEDGVGELVVVDVGGATTDIYSISSGAPTRPNVAVKGIPDPHEKRTVEGDLGIRYNALSILEVAGEKKIKHIMSTYSQELEGNLDIEERVKRLAQNVDYLAQSETDHALDSALAHIAVDSAMQRHAGNLQEVFLLCGRSFIQRGKDLSDVQLVIGTGGIFSYGKYPHQILSSALSSTDHPESLRPVRPRLAVDRNYILFAVGLLGEHAPTLALRIMKQGGLVIEDPRSHMSPRQRTRKSEMAFDTCFV